VSAAEPLLRAADVAKAFDGVRALGGASLDVRAGEVHALVGENGAGKSTLVKILTGALAPDGGAVYAAGTPVREFTPAAARALGVAAIHQQPALFPTLTVAENLALGSEGGRWWRRVDWGARRRRAEALLARVGARVDPDAEAGTLSAAEQQLVEIARALGADARVLILDEPTAALPQADVERLFGVVRELRARGAGVVYISHRLEELPALADRVTVLRDGHTVETRPMAGVSREALIRLMVGRDVSLLAPRRPCNIGAPALELRGLGCAAAGVHDVDLTVRCGEVVGLAGLVGAGRSELARVLFGLTPADRGEIRLHGRPVTVPDPHAAIALGIAYLPEDRRRHGVIAGMSVDANVTLASLDRLSRHGALDRRRERAAAGEFVRRLGVKTPSLDAAVGTLSGGNQQKVALGRWLMTEPSVLIADEPTQGIDVGAKAEVHALLGELAERGVAVLLISSELPEVIGLSDRVAVMRGGTVVDVCDQAEATPERLLGHALGSGRAAAGSDAAAAHPAAAHPAAAPVAAALAS
jgi:rhamnose transport system ATP-binding protein